MVISMFEFDEESYELAKMAHYQRVRGSGTLCQQDVERPSKTSIESKPTTLRVFVTYNVWSKQLVLRLQRLYPTILDQPILVSSTIENKMSPECFVRMGEGEHQTQEGIIVTTSA